MEHQSDQDGKSKTASAVDEKHYPPISQKEHETPNGPPPITEVDIAERAYEIWIRNGSPAGTAQEDWLEAERQLHDALISRRLTQMTHEKGGSVQS
jgi:hypothetical protein